MYIMYVVAKLVPCEEAHTYGVVYSTCDMAHVI